MRFDIITVFPNVFESYLSESLIRRAAERKIIEVRTHNLRDFTKERHRKVDNRPYGGGPGMVLQVEPIYKAVEFAKGKSLKANRKQRIILFSTRGKQLDAKVAQRLAKYDQIIFICGRYEGVDERVAKNIADEEVSIGPYVLSGGELPALVTIETISRFLPGFLGKLESLEDIKGFYPVYTRPPEFRSKGATRTWSVPKVLLSGAHTAIEKWRSQKK